MKRKLKQLATTLKRNNEQDARRALIEELFYDFHSSRSQVYTVNFVRGIVFGAGSVIGGTLVIALIIWTLTLLGNVIPPLGDFFDSITTTLESRNR